MAKKTLYGLTERDKQILERVIREHDRNARPVSVPRSGKPNSSGHIHYFRNDSGETVPAGGIMRKTGTELVDGALTYVMGKPTTSDFSPPWYVNLGRDIADDDHGWCSTFEDEDGLAYYLSGTIAVGDSWGPKGGQWNLERYYPGFFIQGNADNGLVVVKQTVPQIILAKADSGGIPVRSSTTVGSDAGVVIQYMNGTTIGATTFVITAYNLSLSAVAADAYLQLTSISGDWFVDYEDCGA